jgi:hypothetical protein
MPRPICCLWRRRRCCPMYRSRTCVRPPHRQRASRTHWGPGVEASRPPSLRLPHRMLSRQTLPPSAVLQMSPPRSLPPSPVTRIRTAWSVMHLLLRSSISPVLRYLLFLPPQPALKHLRMSWARRLPHPLHGEPTVRHGLRLRWMLGHRHPLRRPRMRQSR